MAERRGFRLLVDAQSRGFATYGPKQPYMYIQDIYVRPAFRRGGIASAMADYIAEEARMEGCTHLLGSVDSNSHGWGDSLKALISYGFVPLRVTGDGGIFLEKKL